MSVSPKQLEVEAKILDLLSGKAVDVAKFMFADKEIQSIQDYANIVSIKRLGYNDHGPVHMRIAALYAMRMFKLLTDAEIKFSLEKEEIGTREDSQIAVLIASLLHDLGMSVSRDKHEFMSIHLATPIIERILSKFYPEDFNKRIILRSLIIEGILGHMATQKVHSLEAGLVLIGDGCDMAKGRARIPKLLATGPKVGDIHRYSSSAINKVIISKGDDKPVKIEIRMMQSVGFFQIEEVLFPKISSSTVKQYVELYAGLNEQDLARYL